MHFFIIISIISNIKLEYMMLLIYLSNLGCH